MADRDRDNGDIHVRDQLDILDRRLDKISGALAETMDDVEREWERLKRTLRWGIVFFVVSITVVVMVLVPSLL